MMKEKFGTFVNPLGSVLSTGEGIDMVQAAGGQLSTQWGIAGNEFTGSNQLASGLYERNNAAFTIGIYGTLLVNNKGRRFSNEGKFANLPLALGGAISLVGGKYYAVVDQAYIDGLASGTDAWTLCGADAENWRTGMMTLKDKPLEKVEEGLEAGQSEGWVFKADSIEELAEAIDAPALVETVETYNAACAAGKDEQFYKPACFLQPVATGPFYAMQYEPSAWVDHRRHPHERPPAGHRRGRAAHRRTVRGRCGQRHAHERSVLRLRGLFAHVRLLRRPFGRAVRRRSHRVASAGQDNRAPKLGEYGFVSS